MIDLAWLDINFLALLKSLRLKQLNESFSLFKVLDMDGRGSIPHRFLRV